MSIDLQDPIAVGRSATEAVSRHASDAVDLARSIDLHAPATAVKHARKRANRAAKHLEHQVDHASKRAAKRVRAESRHVANAAGGRRRGRKLVVALLVVAGVAAVAAVVSRRTRGLDAADTVPDPFGTAVHATDPLHGPDTSSVTTG